MSARCHATLRALSIATAAVLLAAGCSSANSGANKGGGASGVLNLGKPDGPQTDNSNPFLSTSAGATLGYRFMIYEPLAMTNQIRPADKAAPWLATDWKWESNFTEVTFTLDPKAKWADGKPLTADDVAYTFELLKKHPALNGNGIPFDGIAVRGKQVELTFKESQYVNQNKIIQQFIVPKHIWQGVKNPETWPNRTPVGSGPYKLKTFTPQTTTLTATPSYWKGRTEVKELRYTAYNDNSAATTALANGKVEWSFVFMPNYKQLFIAKDPKNHKLWFPSGLGVHGLWFNTARKPFDNPALRRAMAMVVDRKAIYTQAEATLYPEITNPTGIPLPAGESFLAPEYKSATTAPDVAGAKKVLAEAGFELSGGVLKDPDGKPVKLTLTDPAAGTTTSPVSPSSRTTSSSSASRPRSRRRRRRPGARTSPTATSTPPCTGPTVAPPRTTCTRTSWTARCSSPSARRPSSATSAASRTTRPPRRSRTSRAPPRTPPAPRP